MFNNIGRKIKGLAKFFFWIVVIASVIAGVLMIFQGLANSRSNANSKIMSVIVGLLIIGGGILLAWLQNFLLYGYGELIDCSQKILRILESKDMDRTVSSSSYSQTVVQPPSPPQQQETIVESNVSSSIPLQEVVNQNDSK